MAGRQVAKRRSFGRIEWRPSGRYRAAYTGPNGRLYRAPATFAARDDAAAWLSARRAEIDLRLWAPEAAERAARRNSLPTFREYAEKWLAGRRTRGRELRPSTASGYRSLLAKHIYPRFGDVVIDQITSADVNTWYDQLTPGRYTTRSKAYSLLRTIMNGAATERPYPLVPYNPAHIRGAGNPDQIHRVRPASLAELQTIVDELPDRYKLMALLGAWCALRLGELCELRRGDIDVERERVMVTRGVVRVDGEFIVGPPKTEAGVRDVAIPPHLMPAVRHHLYRHTGRRADALLFPATSDPTVHMQPATLYKVFYRARAVAGRKDLRWHDLRHTGAVLAAQTGATLADLMGRLGHTTPAAAMRYQHASADRDAEIARRLSELARA